MKATKRDDLTIKTRGNSVLDDEAFLQNFTASNVTVPQDSIDAGCMLNRKLSFGRRMQLKKKSD